MNELGNTNRYGYDAKGRLRYETNANNEILQYTYNPLDDISTLTDGKNQVTSWGYDIYGRVITKTNATSNLVFTNTYDAMHRLASRWTPAKGTTAYGYDVMGNLTDVDYPGSVMDITYQYDLLGRMTNMTDAVGTTKFGYTAGGQLSSENGPWSDDTVSYAYNNRHRSNLSVRQPNATAWEQTYGYNTNWLINQINSPAGSFNYNYYYGDGDLVSTVYYPSPGSRVDNGYDSFGRLYSTALYMINAQVNYHGYSYDASNQRTQQVFMADAYGNNKFMDYTYDKIGQLKTATGMDNAIDINLGDYVIKPRLNEQFGYAYDAAWNLERRTNNSLVQTFGSNSRNELTNATRSGTLTVAGTAGIIRSQYGYDYGVTNVTVSGNGLSSGSAEIYSDGTWARTNATLADGVNIYTAVAQDSYGRTDTDSLTNDLPATVAYQYDANGNLTNDGLRVLEYDYENLNLYEPNPSTRDAMKKRWGGFSVANGSQANESSLTLTEHPNGMPTSDRCPGQPLGRTWETVSFLFLHKSNSVMNATVPAMSALHLPESKYRSKFYVR